MIKYLDNCKENKINCECSGVLKFNPNETDEFKKWSFIYQCDHDKYKVNQMENTTKNLLNDIKNKKQEVYNVKKSE